MSEKKKRNIIICSLCGVLLLMVVGYAAFSTMLNINGTTSITSNWKVLITNIISKDKIGGAYDIEAPSHTELEATFKTGLISPGDSIKYDITVENQGNLDAYVSKITINKTKDNPAILIESSGLEENDKLTPQESKILTIKVTYNSEVTEDPEDKSANFKVTLDFGQKILAQSELIWACPEGYNSSDEAGSDMTCSKTVYTDYTTSTEQYCPSGAYLSWGQCNGNLSGCRCSRGSGRYSTVAGSYNYIYDCDTLATYPSCSSCSLGTLACGANTCTCTTGPSRRTTYSCPGGYTKSGSGTSTTCSKTETTSPEQVTKYTCPEGYILQEDNTCDKE